MSCWHTGGEWDFNSGQESAAIKHIMQSPTTTIQPWFWPPLLRCFGEHGKFEEFQPSFMSRILTGSWPNSWPNTGWTERTYTKFAKKNDETKNNCCYPDNLSNGIATLYKNVSQIWFTTNFNRKRIWIHLAFTLSLQISGGWTTSANILGYLE